MCYWERRALRGPACHRSAPVCWSGLCKPVSCFPLSGPQSIHVHPRAVSIHARQSFQLHSGMQDLGEQGAGCRRGCPAAGSACWAGWGSGNITLELSGALLFWRLLTRCPREGCAERCSEPCWHAIPPCQAPSPHLMPLPFLVARGTPLSCLQRAPSPPSTPGLPVPICRLLQLQSPSLCTSFP